MFENCGFKLHELFVLVDVFDNESAVEVDIEVLGEFEVPFCSMLFEL